MGLEFGKWLMDVAKYMLTALLLASFFGDMNTPGMVAIAILIMMVILGLGLLCTLIVLTIKIIKERKENNYDYTRN